MEPNRAIPAGPLSGRRSQSRLRVRLPARLTTLSGTTGAILTDLSTGGAKLIVAAPLEAGREAMLHWGGFEAFGTIGWTHDGMCGLAFDDPVAPKILFATRDLDDAEHLRSEREQVREVARSWVEGSLRL